MLFFNRHKKLTDTDFFQHYTESHCHILPGVDDGVQEMQETLEILKQYESLGIRDVWITPHVMEDTRNSSSLLKQDFEELLNVWTKYGSGSLQLHLAAEYMLYASFTSILNGGDYLLHASNRLLVETSYFNPPGNFHSLLQSIKEKGISPLLAHPERYEYMDNSDYAELKRKGILFQLNLPSLIGYYGKAAKKKAEYLLNKGWYNAIGMDLHSASQLCNVFEAELPVSLIKKIESI